MENYFAKNLIMYIEKIKKDQNFKSDSKAIEYLLKQISERDQGVVLSDRAVRKWINGESYPDMDRVCILADIMNVTTDELLKDRISKIRDDNIPIWYEELSDNSKKVLLKCLEPYNTGKFSAVKDRQKFNYLQALYNVESGVYYNERFFKAHDTTKEEYLKLIEVGNDIDSTVDFYFKMAGEGEDFKIYFDEYYDYNEIVAKEIKKHKKNFSKLRIEEYFKNKEINRDELDRFATDMYNVTDFGYVECVDECGTDVYLYGEENWICEEEGVKVTYDDFDEENDHENQIGYFVRDERCDPPYQWNATHNQKKKIEKNFYSNIDRVIETFFRELIDKNLLKLYQIAQSGVEIYDRYGDHNSDNYFKLSFCLNIDNEDIVKILTSGIRENIREKIENRKKRIATLDQNAKESAKLFDNLWKEVRNYEK